MKFVGFLLELLTSKHTGYIWVALGHGLYYSQFRVSGLTVFSNCTLLNIKCQFPSVHWPMNHTQPAWCLKGAFKVYRGDWLVIGRSCAFLGVFHGQGCPDLDPPLWVDAIGHWCSLWYLRLPFAPVMFSLSPRRVYFTSFSCHREYTLSENTRFIL